MTTQACRFCGGDVPVVRGRLADHTSLRPSCPLSGKVPWRSAPPSTELVRAHLQHHPGSGESLALFQVSVGTAFHCVVTGGFAPGEPDVVRWSYALPDESAAPIPYRAGRIVPPVGDEWLWRPFCMFQGEPTPWVDDLAADGHEAPRADGAECGGCGDCDACEYADAPIPWGWGREAWSRWMEGVHMRYATLGLTEGTPNRIPVQERSDMAFAVGVLTVMASTAAMATLVSSGEIRYTEGA